MKKIYYFTVAILLLFVFSCSSDDITETLEKSSSQQARTSTRLSAKQFSYHFKPKALINTIIKKQREEKNIDDEDIVILDNEVVLIEDTSIDYRSYTFQVIVKNDKNISNLVLVQQGEQAFTAYLITYDGNYIKEIDEDTIENYMGVRPINLNETLITSLTSRSSSECLRFDYGYQGPSPDIYVWGSQEACEVENGFGNCSLYSIDITIGGNCNDNTTQEFEEVDYGTGSGTSGTSGVVGSPSGGSGTGSAGTTTETPTTGVGSSGTPILTTPLLPDSTLIEDLGNKRLLKDLMAETSFQTHFEILKTASIATAEKREILYAGLTNDAGETIFSYVGQSPINGAEVEIINPIIGEISSLFHNHYAGSSNQGNLLPTFSAADVSNIFSLAYTSQIQDLNDFNLLLVTPQQDLQALMITNRELFNTRLITWGGFPEQLVLFLENSYEENLIVANTASENGAMKLNNILRDYGLTVYQFNENTDRWFKP